MQNELQRITDEKLEIALARTDYSFYLEYVYRGLYKHGRHTRLICDKLKEVELGDIDRLIITMPPRHSKSFTVTESFPSYYIGKSPDRRVILGSYGYDLARRFGNENKRKVGEYGGKLFGISVSRENATGINWSLQDHRGGMISAGVGGSVTGEGADLLIIDDPIKNDQEARSPAYRERLWGEWQNTFLTRLHPGGAIIVIATRWHEDDLIGRLLQLEPERWDVLSLPCECEDEDDPLGRKIGDPLWPEYGYDKEWMDDQKSSVGAYTWSALYQQRPSPPGGEVIKKYWWKFWCYPGQQDELSDVIIKVEDETLGAYYANIRPEPIPREFEKLAQSWDMSFKDSSDASYVVGQVWGKHEANKYLLDQLRNRMDFPATLSAVRALSKKWPEAITKWVEDKANGPAVIDTLKREISGLIPVNPQGGKEVRANAVSPEIQSGNVYLPHPSICPWVHDFIEECAAFPHGQHDDQVDSMTQALFKFSSTRKAQPARAVSLKRKKSRK